MDKKYIKLFKEMAKSLANTAETVMEYNKANDDEKGLATATSMRNEYQNLADEIDNAGDSYILTKSSSAKLLIGAMVLTNQLQDKIATITKAINGYKNDVIPKLQEIIEKAENDEDAAKMANEKFIIENNK